jgi:MFS family permease
MSGRFARDGQEDASRRPSEADAGIRRGQVRRALVASTVGTSIEWYDFFLYGTAAALVFPKLFFPDASQYAGVLASFAIYAVGFAARPVGAAIFGHWGDRIGRKATLISTLMLMGIASFLIGVMPTYGSIGVWAPTILVVLRLLQGIGVGGEWGGSVTLAMEWGNPRRRGLMGSWPQVGVPIGLLLSTGAVSLFSHITGSSFETWGWRIPLML